MAPRGSPLVFACPLDPVPAASDSELVPSEQLIDEPAPPSHFPHTITRSPELTLETCDVTLETLPLPGGLEPPPLPYFTIQELLPVGPSGKVPCVKSITKSSKNDCLPASVPDSFCPILIC